MAAENGRLQLRIAENEEDLVSSMRLRYNVFAKEFGASGPCVDHDARTESDRYDDCVDHLVLVDSSRGTQDLDHVIGVYRLLRSDIALANFGFYCQSEFDLSTLIETGRPLVELGRMCVHKDYRSGLAVIKLWQGVADYVLDHGIDIMFGTASFVGTDSNAVAEPLSMLYRNHLAPEDIRVVARPENYVEMNPNPPNRLSGGVSPDSMPSLINAYLRRGAFVGEGAFLDAEFNTIDVCMLIDTERMPQRYRQYYTRGWGKR